VADRGEAAPLAARAPVPADDKKAAVEPLADANGRLLMNRKVLRDMRCDIDQLDRIMDALEEAEKKAQQKTGEAMGQLKFNFVGGAPDPEVINKAIREAHETGEKEFRKAVAAVATDILTPAQRKRFREIDLQARGHTAFAAPEVVRALDITAEQKEQLEGIAARVEGDAAQAVPKQFPAPPAAQIAPAPFPGAATAIAGFNPGDYEKAVRGARAEALKRALAVLTDEQRAGWKKLTGAPFAHPLPLPGGGPFQTRTFAVPGGGFGGFAPAMPLLPAAPALPAQVAPGGIQALPATPAPAPEK
jgi:hypothetical protein